MTRRCAQMYFSEPEICLRHTIDKFKSSPCYLVKMNEALLEINGYLESVAHAVRMKSAKAEEERSNYKERIETFSLATVMEVSDR